MPEHCVHDMVKDWCGICRGEVPKVRSRSNHLMPEVVLLRPTRPSLCNFLAFWQPDVGEQVTGLPPEADTVHLVGTTSMSRLRQLVQQCPNLRVIEGTPSQKHFFLRNLTFFASLGIGISLVVRGPKSRAKDENWMYSSTGVPS